MKIVKVEVVRSTGKYAESREWAVMRAMLHDAISRVSWPPGAQGFAIYPESGKRSGQGNGVKPIKDGLMRELEAKGWKLEQSLGLAEEQRTGKLDAVLDTAYGRVALEWETGNISSSHRALNKMSLGLMHGALVCGILIVPSRNLARFLTDRVGNMAELEMYLSIWRKIAYDSGVLEIVVVEHDRESTDVPKIPKGTDGRALR